MKSRRTVVPPAVTTPAVKQRSFTATGMPCSGPRYSPRPIAASAAAASASAASAVSVR